MTPTPKPKGRPAMGVERHNISLTPDDWQRLCDLGDGSPSAGIRVLLETIPSAPPKKRPAGRRVEVELRGDYVHETFFAECVEHWQVKGHPERVVVIGADIKLAEWTVLKSSPEPVRKDD